MEQRVLLTLGQGDWQQGFASITLQLWEAGSNSPVQFSGSLPAATDLARRFQQWRSLYVTLYGHCGVWRRSAESDGADSADPTSPARGPAAVDGFPIEIDDEDITHVSGLEFIQLGQELRQRFNLWLESPTFRAADRQLRTYLSRDDEIRLVLAAQNQTVLRYPWHLWQLLEDYPQAELALSPLTYQRSVKKAQPQTPDVRVLAILGNADGIDVATDQRLLSDLPGAAVTILAEPSLEAVNQQLWQGPWDILFFGGHSSSQAAGVLQLNRHDAITLTDLKYGLRNAIANGLQLAIFNSCDGLGLAWDLADLNIPQVIVMREPVPDLIAHLFLTGFLAAFADNQPLYLSVRAAREQLQAHESLCPCATWLPVIVQNPAEPPASWQRLRGICGKTPQAAPLAGIAPLAAKSSAAQSSEVRGSLLRSLWIPIATTAVVVGLRLLGGLAPIELHSFDQLMRLRPGERPDPRFLVVTVDEADIQAQPPEGRGGSLSDEALEQLLINLERHGARLVGLDIYRDYAVSSDHPALAERLSRSERLVGVCKSRDPVADPIGVKPPPELAEELVGFSDFLDDPDGIVRRHLISLQADPVSVCTTPYAFSARLAFLYLRGEDIDFHFDDGGSLVLGEVVVPKLQSRSGGYQKIDANGYQALLNYRALSDPSDIAQQVSLTQLLNDQVNPEAIADRI
ncbi:MAG: CHASE2 domain-containing protein, partial [Cyanobacteria bacterium P01_A01_bin.135]